jgi:hypothetical protein
MACESIRTKLADLRQQKREIEQWLPVNHQGPGYQMMLENLSNIEAQIRVEEANLESCEAWAEHVPGVSPRRRFTGWVKQLRCVEAGAEIGDQEPYVIVAAVDLRAFPVPPPLHCTLVGPWANIRAGMTRFSDSDSKRFWDLDGAARVVATPRDVIFIAAVVENDGAGPDAIRGAVEGAMKVTFTSSLGRAYDTLADDLVSSMVGAVDTFGSLGIGPPDHLNADDRIGVAHVELTTDDLDTIDVLGTLDKNITVIRRRASGKISDQYTVTLTFET